MVVLRILYREFGRMGTLLKNFFGDHELHEEKKALKPQMTADKC
jgi:hypothetical protein